MATEKKITSRIQQKHDVAANWAKATNFIPKKGEIIIYDAEYSASGEETQAVRFKIGDGSKTVNNLPFAAIDYKSIKSINTNNTTAQAVNASEAIAGSGTINLHKVAKTGSYNDLLHKPTIPAAANNGKLTIQKNGTDVATFTANQSTNVTANITVPTKVSEIANDSGYTTNKGTVTSVSIKMNGASKGTVTSSGTIDLGTVITSHQDISGKLDKTTYEWNKEFRASRNGAISLGRYNVYDTQLTFDISSTTDASISGKLVIATQNGIIRQAKVFGDATGILVSKIVIYQSAIVNNRSWVEVFCNFDGWSKNKVHIYGVALDSATVTNQMSSVTFTNGVPSPITSGDSKWSGTIDNDLSGKQNKLTAGSNITISGNTISAKDTTYTFTANNPTLAWNTTSKIGTIGGVEFNVKMPANPNTNTATAADNILDGSNSGTQITYKPYTSQQSKLSFDSSNTEPTRTDRLNLNGYLYATKLYSGGKEVLTSHQPIPTVNNGKLTIQKNGTTVQTFTANQSSSVTANIIVPTKVSQLTNDSGYTTNKGTVTSVAIKMNGSEKGKVTSSGTIDLGTVLTAMPQLKWVTPTSVDEIKSAILWKVTNEKSADKHGGIEIAIGSGQIGNGSGYNKYNSANYYGLCNVNIISDSQTFVELIPFTRSVPNQQYRTNIVLSNWKILKLG